MKKLAMFMAAAGLILAGTGAVQAAVVNVSLEPSTDTVQVGNTFDLDLWLRSSDGSTIVMSDIELLLTWDPAYVSFSGSASTVDGDYDWTSAMSFPPMDPFPMYPWEGSAGENATYDDGDAWIMLYPGFAPFRGMAKPQTDLRALTLTFTALAVTGSTTNIAPSLGTPGAPPTEGDPYRIVEDVTGVYIGGSVSGSDVEIVPEPATMCLLALGGLGLIRRRRRK